MTTPDLYRLPGSTSLRGFALRSCGAVLVSFGLVLVLLAQFFARQLAFHPVLGRPLLPAVSVPLPLLCVFGAGAALCLLLRPLRPFALVLVPAAVLLAVAGEPVYSPLHLVSWLARFRHFSSTAPLCQTVSRSLLLAGTVHAGALIALLLAGSHRLADDFDIHGSARWARRAEVAGAGLLGRPTSGAIAGPPGLFLGFWPDKSRKVPLYDDGPHHVFVFAPTRSGKGVGLVVPNLLLWRGSVVVCDIKGENYALTAGFRQRELNNAVLRYDPTWPHSSRWNPLREVRLGDYEVRDAQNIADILVDPNGDKLRDHWDRTAHALLTALILHVLYAEEDKTLRGCAFALSRPGKDVLTTFRDMLRTPHLPTGPHPLVASIAQSLLDKSDDERSGVISTALSFLDLYRDPLIAQATAASDFQLTDLMQVEQPVSLYLTIPASDLSRTRPLVRLLLNLLCRRLTETLEFRDGQPVAHYRHPLLLLLDEFPALGRLPFFSESIAYLAGYGIRCLLVTQDLSQHQGVYGKSESIVSNCSIRIAYTPNKPETAELLSLMTGQMTVHHTRVSRRLGGPLTASQTATPSETQRRLLTPDEALRLPADQALVFVTGLPPLLTLRARYFEDSELLRRARIPPPDRPARLRGDGNGP